MEVSPKNYISNWLFQTWFKVSNEVILCGERTFVFSSRNWSKARNGNAEGKHATNVIQVMLYMSHAGERDQARCVGTLRRQTEKICPHGSRCEVNSDCFSLFVSLARPQNSSRRQMAAIKEQRACKKRRNQRTLHQPIGV